MLLHRNIISPILESSWHIVLVTSVTDDNSLDA